MKRTELSAKAMTDDHQLLLLGYKQLHSLVHNAHDIDWVRGRTCCERSASVPGQLEANKAKVRLQVKAHIPPVEG